MNIIIAAVVITAAILIFKLVQLQLLDVEFIERAKASAIQERTTYPARGLLYDRNNRLLVQNEAIYDLVFTASKVDPDMDTLKFCNLLGIDLATFENNIQKDWSRPMYSRHVPAIFMGRIDPETFAAFQEHLHQFPGFEFVLRNVRSYPHQHAAHVLGYISEVNRETINRFPGIYQPGDFRGASGLELIYEPSLRGSKGLELILRDNLGRHVGSFSGGILDTPAVSGQNLQSTLDIELQAYAEKLMKNKKGSVVALDPATGEILAMASSPTYDPNNLVIKRGRGDAFLELVRDSLQPLFNRSIQAKYPPGSVFKPVLALIALEEEVLNARRHITCQGAYYYRSSRWGCVAGAGTRNVTRAVHESCNSFFFQIYRDLLEREGFANPQPGLEKLNEYLDRFGLGSRLGVDIPGEISGHVPNDDFYRRLYASEGGRWYSTYTLSNAIGQGELEMTTLQMANLAAIIANGGYFYPPHLIRGKILDNGEVEKLEKDRRETGVSSEHFDVVTSGMELAVRAGSGRMAYIPGLDVCGKTGTSQNPHGDNHSVFYAFAPKDDPQIAVAVYVENAGWGSTFAAPIAGLIIEKYLNEEISRGRQWIENRMLEADLLTIP